MSAALGWCLIKQGRVKNSKFKINECDEDWVSVSKIIQKYQIKLHFSFNVELGDKVAYDLVYPFYKATRIHTYQSHILHKTIEFDSYTPNTSREYQAQPSFLSSQLCGARLQYHFLSRSQTDIQNSHKYMYVNGFISSNIRYLLFPHLKFLFWTYFSFFVIKRLAVFCPSTNQLYATSSGSLLSKF